MSDNAIGHGILADIDLIYKGYAHLFHTANTKKAAIKECSSIEEMMDDAESRGALIYGEEIFKEAKPDILMVSHELSMAGAPIALLHLADVLKDLGHQVIIISAKDGKQLAEYCCKNQIPVLVDPLVFHSDYILRIRKLFSLIIVNTIVSAPVIGMLSGTDSKVIWWIHEAKNCYGRRSARQMPFSVSDNIQIYVAGEYALKQLIRKYPRYNVRSFIYGIPEFPKGERHGGSHYNRVYTSIGALNKRKGSDIFADAIDRLPKEVRDGSLFVFVGKMRNGEIARRISKLREKYPSHVKYIGEIDHQRIFDIYSQTDFLVISSRDDPLPVVAAEAMSFGRPCICSENTGSADYIMSYHTGTVYGGNSPKELAQRIKETYYMDRETYKTMADNSKRLYEHVFSVDALRDRIMKNNILPWEVQSR